MSVCIHVSHNLPLFIILIFILPLSSYSFRLFNRKIFLTSHPEWLFNCRIVFELPIEQIQEVRLPCRLRFLLYGWITQTHWSSCGHTDVTTLDVPHYHPLLRTLSLVQYDLEPVTLLEPKIYLTLTSTTSHNSSSDCTILNKIFT